MAPDSTCHCGAPAYSKGFCVKHYHQDYRKRKKALMAVEQLNFLDEPGEQVEADDDEWTFEGFMLSLN